MVSNREWYIMLLQLLLPNRNNIMLHGSTKCILTLSCSTFVSGWSKEVNLQFVFSWLEFDVCVADSIWHLTSVSPWCPQDNFLNRYYNKTENIIWNSCNEGPTLFPWYLKLWFIYCSSRPFFNRGSEADSSVHVFLLLRLVEDEDTAVLFIFGWLKLLLKLIRPFLIIINIS